MKRTLALTLLMMVVTSTADAQWFNRGWWKHHILCMCGQPPAKGNTQ